MAFGARPRNTSSAPTEAKVGTPRVVHCKKEEFDVYIGRPSKFGNPFSHLPKSIADIKVANRDEAVDFYEEWVLGNRIVPGQTPPSLAEIKQELQGKVLACWCSPARCHGDVLMRLANAPSDVPVATGKKPSPP